MSQLTRLPRNKTLAIRLSLWSRPYLKRGSHWCTIRLLIRQLEATLSMGPPWSSQPVQITLWISRLMTLNLISPWASMRHSENHPISTWWDPSTCQFSLIYHRSQTREPYCNHQEAANETKGREDKYSAGDPVRARENTNMSSLII